MSLPDEKYRSLIYTKQFLYDLLDPKKRPKNVKELRQRTGACLRHFLYDHEIEKLALRSPDILEAPKRSKK